MHSKWKLWDFFKSHSDSINEGEYGIYSFYAFDPLISKLFVERIPRAYLEGEKLNVLVGNEITEQWIEDNLMSLGLFGNSDSYLIHFAEKIPKHIQEKFLSGELICDSRYIILVFNDQNDFAKQLTKNDLIKSIEVSAPMFWENKELLEFFSSYLSVYLSYEASQIILDSLEPGCSEYYNLLSQLKINFPEKTIEKDMLLSVMEKNKLDQFELAALFSSKKFNDFYEILIERLKENSFYSLNYFMQSHLLKLMDTSYLDGKKKLSKYDRQILNDSKKWNKVSLLRAISYFKKLEVIFRENESLFIHNLKKDFLKSF